MSEDKAPVCFQCGNPVTTPPRIHRLASGKICGHCHDRFLEAQPCLLPEAAGAEEGAEVGQGDSGPGLYEDASGDLYGNGDHPA